MSTWWGENPPQSLRPVPFAGWSVLGRRHGGLGHRMQGSDLGSPGPFSRLWGRPSPRQALEQRPLGSTEPLGKPYYVTSLVLRGLHDATTSHFPLISFSSFSFLQPCFLVLVSFYFASFFRREKTRRKDWSRSHHGWKGKGDRWGPRCLRKFLPSCRIHILQVTLCGTFGIGVGLGSAGSPGHQRLSPWWQLAQLDVFHPSPGLLTTNQCLEYISQRHQLLKHVSISGFWAFLPFQSSQWLESAWLMCPRLAEPSDFTVLHILDNNCPPCLSLTWHWPPWGKQQVWLILVSPEPTPGDCRAEPRPWHSWGTRAHQEGRATFTRIHIEESGSALLWPQGFVVKQEHRQQGWLPCQPHDTNVFSFFFMFGGLCLESILQMQN